MEKLTVPKAIRIGSLTIGGGKPLVLIAGPCVIESKALTIEIAKELKSITAGLGIPLIFKASFDKANRTSVASFRGPGLKEGLEILGKVKAVTGLPVLTDIHQPEQAEVAAQVVDILQIPAFLCRQTDLIVAAAKTGRVLHLKKGQFLGPWDMKQVVFKAVSAGAENILLGERGACFGYNNLVVDFRGIPYLRGLGYPVVFDATHAVQLPGGKGDSSGGEREFVEYLSKAAVAVGVDALFWEVHPQPDRALCDAPNSLPLDELVSLLTQLKAIDGIIKR